MKHARQTGHEKLYRIALRNLSHPWKLCNSLITFKSPNTHKQNLTQKVICNFFWSCQAMISPTFVQCTKHTVPHTYLYWNDKMSSIFEEVVSINSYNTSLIRLSDICKNSIYHSWKKIYIERLPHFYTKWCTCISILVILHSVSAIYHKEFVKEQLLHRMYTQVIPTRKGYKTWLVHVKRIA